MAGKGATPQLHCTASPEAVHISIYSFMDQPVLWSCVPVVIGVLNAAGELLI